MVERSAIVNTASNGVNSERFIRNIKAKKSK